MSGQSFESPRLGGKLAIALFACTLFAFTAESQLTQYVQTNLHYRHPIFIFYLVHSSFIIMFPLHIVYLRITSGYKFSSLMNGLALSIASQSPSSAPGQDKGLRIMFQKRFLVLIGCLTVGITFPGLLWFASVTLSSISDVTAIWNTNAFFAYLISIRVFKVKLEIRRLIAVVLATGGVLVVVYGGSANNQEIKPESQALSLRPTAPLIGDLLTLLASVLYALYQVLYKKFAALPTDPELRGENYTQLSASLDPEADDPVDNEKDIVYPPPFGLHPNMITSLIGLCTLLALWIPIPILHYFGVETFALPPSLKVAAAIMGIALTGVIFNAGFMILLGLWGPVVTSVGGLLTIVLVFFSDLIFSGTSGVSIWSILGSTAIVIAFGMLAYDMLKLK